MRFCPTDQYVREAHRDPDGRPLQDGELPAAASLPFDRRAACSKLKAEVHEGAETILIPRPICSGLASLDRWQGQAPFERGVHSTGSAGLLDPLLQVQAAKGNDGLPDDRRARAVRTQSNCLLHCCICCTYAVVCV